MRFEEFLQGTLGAPLESTVGELRYDCPFCSDTKKRFYVKQSLDSKNGQYICFNCGETGNPITFMKRYYNVDSRNAVKLLEQNNIEIDIDKTIKFDNSLSDSEKLILLLRGVEPEEYEVKKKPPKLPFNYKFLSQNLYNKEAIPFLRYLNSRGVTLQQIIEHNIAYTVESKCYKSDNIQTFTFYNSLIFFTYNAQGEYVYWNTRSIVPTKMKTINAPASDEQYGKKDVLFNFNKAKDQRMLIITEGVFDALTFHQYGIATFGKAVSDNQIKLIKKYVKPETDIYLMLDSDAYEYNVKVARELFKKFPNTYVVPHGEEDPNDLGTEKAFQLIKDKRIKATPEGLTNYEIQQKLIN